MASRGFGVAAAIPGEWMAPLAKAAETAGYATFWVNDTPGADALPALAAAAEATSSIRLAVGVIPLDRREPDEIASTIVSLGLPTSRLVLGVGSGGALKGSLELVEAGIHRLRDLTDCSIAVGALGPRMIQLAGDHADGVVLNWLTPQWIETCTAGLRSAPTATTEIIGYVRTALPGARTTLQAEAQRYESFPQYGRHFERMGVPAFDTCVLGEAGEIQKRLAAFDAVLDETVVRAIVADQSLVHYSELLEAAAPNR